jgi:hypothetical protein
MQKRRKPFRTKADKEKASARTLRGWETKRQNGTATWGKTDRPADRLPEGEFIGVLQWHDASGSVKRWTIRQGKRANQVRLVGMKQDHGWDYLTRKLRTRLGTKKLTTI